MRTELYLFLGRKLQAPESNRVTDLMKVSSVPTSLQCQVSGIRLQTSDFRHQVLNSLKPDT